MKEQPTATQLRDQGMARATAHADREVPLWSHQAYHFLRSYARYHEQFMAEDVRMASRGVIDEPPSARAWGSVFARAARAGFITRAGYRSVKNVKAHCTPATVWATNKN